jgi:hypothetical protein
VTTSDLHQLRWFVEGVGLRVRWEMTPEQRLEVERLVAALGAQQLAEVAIETSGRSGTPTFACSWLPAWRKAEWQSLSSEEAFRRVCQIGDAVDAELAAAAADQGSSARSAPARLERASAPNVSESTRRISKLASAFSIVFRWGLARRHATASWMRQSESSSRTSAMAFARWAPSAVIGFLLGRLVRRSLPSSAPP